MYLFSKRLILPVSAKITAIVAPVVLALSSAEVRAEVEFTGQAAFEQRFFISDALDPVQPDSQASIYLQPEWYSSWNDGDNSLLFKPFVRIDEVDHQRSHVDIRELLWMKVGYDWELRAGVSKVFWGQTESQHLVDVINQTDAIEALDGEDKLGQPMVNLSFIRDWGTTSFFLLPYFRERTWASLEGRLRPGPKMLADEPIFESDQEKHHIDYALRYSHTIGDWDVGLSYFDGTSREPYLEPEFRDGERVLRPLYLQMEQFGVDLLSVWESWLFKFEGIYRENSRENFFALTGGFEYTQVGVFDTAIDLGWLMEYQYDERDLQATVPGQNDMMFGTRLAFNDVEGTEILVGYVQDLDNSGSFSGFVEASARINDSFKWSVDAWFFNSVEPQEILYSLRKDDYVQFALEYYF